MKDHLNSLIFQLQSCLKADLNHSVSVKTGSVGKTRHRGRLSVSKGLDWEEQEMAPLYCIISFVTSLPGHTHTQGSTQDFRNTKVQNLSLLEGFRDMSSRKKWRFPWAEYMHFKKFVEQKLDNSSFKTMLEGINDLSSSLTWESGQMLQWMSRYNLEIQKRLKWSQNILTLFS